MTPQSMGILRPRSAGAIALGQREHFNAERSGSGLCCLPDRKGRT